MGESDCCIDSYAICLSCFFVSPELNRFIDRSPSHLTTDRSAHRCLLISLAVRSDKTKRSKKLKTLPAFVLRLLHSRVYKLSEGKPLQYTRLQQQYGTEHEGVDPGNTLGQQTREGRTSGTWASSRMKRDKKKKKKRAITSQQHMLK